MKKLRLTILILISIVTFQNCSPDTEEVNEIEKAAAVKALLTAFSKTVYSDEYQSFLRQNLETGTSSRTSSDQMIEEFINSQSDEFKELYNQVIILNLTKEEFWVFANANEHLKPDYSQENSAGGRVMTLIPNLQACAVSIALSQYNLLGEIGKWVHC